MSQIFEGRCILEEGAYRVHVTYEKMHINPKDTHFKYLSQKS